MYSELPLSKKLKMIGKSSESSLSSITTQLDAKSLNRFSRQNAALGAETTAKLTKMKVLIYGMKGTGIEIAKNLSLQGIGSITVSLRISLKTCR